MTEPDLTAGSEVDSYCLKCKDMTNHMVIAMVDGVIAKAQCNVCGGRHKYRVAKPSKSTKTKNASGSRAAASTTLKEKKATATFEALLKGRDASSVGKPYAMTSIFNKNEVIDHPTFGIGVVTSIIPANKIEVTFKDGVKILICVLPAPEVPAPVRTKKKKLRKVVKEEAA